MMKSAVFALAIGLILLSGCAPPSTVVPEPTAAEAPPTEVVPEPIPSAVSLEALIGTWQRDGAASVTQYNEDGTYTYASNKFVLLEENPIAVGEFRLEGNLLIMTTDESQIKSCVGQTGTYEIALTEEGKLHSEVVEDKCRSRATEWNDKLWSRISP